MSRPIEWPAIVNPDYRDGVSTLRQRLTEIASKLNASPDFAAEVEAHFRAFGEVFNLDLAPEAEEG